MKILITAPNLDEKRHVSGISTVVRQIVARGAFDYEHFSAGRTDGERARARWAAQQSALPVEFYRRLRSGKFDVAHINTALNPLSIVRDYALTRAARAARVPVLLHVHGGKYLAADFDRNWLRRVAERMLASAETIVVLSELEKNILARRGQNERVKVLENAVAAADYAAANAANKPRSARKTIVFLGRLHESKGLREIVAATRVLKDEGFCFNFECYGAGAERDFFVGAMREILGDRFHFGGVVSGAEKVRVLAASDIFVLPSRYGEGLPMAMLEAMAAGCTIVASEMASVGAVVRDGENGFLVEPGNAAALAEKLKSILAGEIDAQTIGKNARATVAARFDLPDYIAKLERIYREIAERTI